MQSAVDADIDAETFDLALKLAARMGTMRSTSRYAVEAFVAALSGEDEVVAARLTLVHEKAAGRLEAQVQIGPDL